MLAPHWAAFPQRVHRYIQPHPSCLSLHHHNIPLSFPLQKKKITPFFSHFTYINITSHAHDGIVEYALNFTFWAPPCRCLRLVIYYVLPHVCLDKRLYHCCILWLKSIPKFCSSNQTGMFKFETNRSRRSVNCLHVFMSYLRLMNLWQKVFLFMIFFLSFMLEVSLQRNPKTVILGVHTEGCRHSDLLNKLLVVAIMYGNMISNSASWITFLINITLKVFNEKVHRIYRSFSSNICL